MFIKNALKKNKKCLNSTNLAGPDYFGMGNENHLKKIFIDVIFVPFYINGNNFKMFVVDASYDGVEPLDGYHITFVEKIVDSHHAKLSHGFIRYTKLGNSISSGEDIVNSNKTLAGTSFAKIIPDRSKKVPVGTIKEFLIILLSCGHLVTKMDI